MWVHIAMTNKRALLAIIMNPCLSLHIGLVGLMCLSESVSRTLLVLFRCSTLHFIFLGFILRSCHSKDCQCLVVILWIWMSIKNAFFLRSQIHFGIYHWNVSSSITQPSLNHVVSTSCPKHAAGSGHST
jgi:hypothetical protein